MTNASYLLAGLGVIRKTCSAIIQRVDKQQRHSASAATRRDILAKIHHVWVGFLHRKHRLDLVLESKVQRLCRKVTNAVRQVTTPERQNACIRSMH